MSGDSTNLKQEFTTELELILESDEAYGSNVQILTYALKEDVINGKFKDSWNNRVYEFIIDVNGISYKPAIKLDSFLTDEMPVRFDSYSKGYTSLFTDSRSDGKLTGKRTKKPKCGVTAYGCGFSCIGLIKTCKILSTGTKTGSHEKGKAIGKERLTKLIARANELDPTQQAATVMQLKSTAKSIEASRSRYTSEGKARQSRRTLARQPNEIPVKPQEKKSAKPKLESTKSTDKSTIPVDRTLFDIKFPPKVEGGTNSYESLVDRVNQAQAMVKGKDSHFADATPSEKGHILKNMTEEYYGADIDYDEKLENAIQAKNKPGELYARAAITRLQAARALWEDMPEKQKRIVARTLKYEEQGRTLLTQKDEVKNPYINELRKEFAKYFVQPKA